MKISAVIPTYTLTKELEELTYQCLYSLAKTALIDEIIVCEDGGFYSSDLVRESSMYLYSRENQGFNKNVNKGIKLATGDYIAIVNSDTRFIRGDMKDLCVPGKVGCPTTRGQDVPGLAGHFFVAPRTIFDEVGFLNEDMKMFCSDADFETKVKDRIIQVPSVVISHEINATLKVAGLMDGKQLEIDREIYSKLK